MMQVMYSTVRQGEEGSVVMSVVSIGHGIHRLLADASYYVRMDNKDNDTDRHGPGI